MLDREREMKETEWRELTLDQKKGVTSGGAHEERERERELGGDVFWSFHEMGNSGENDGLG